MRRVVPDGWKVSPQAVRMFLDERNRWLGVVRGQVSRFSKAATPCFDCDDMFNEGTMLALYALDRYIDEPRSDGPDTLIAVMVRCHLTDRVRGIRNDRKRREAYAARVPMEDLVAVPNPPEPWTWDEFIAWRQRVRVFWQALPVRVRGVLYLRLYPPPELVVLSRNLWSRDRRTVSNRAIAVFTGLSRRQVKRALASAREAAAELLGRRNRSRDSQEHEILGHDVRLSHIAEGRAESSTGRRIRDGSGLDVRVGELVAQG